MDNGQRVIACLLTVIAVMIGLNLLMKTETRAEAQTSNSSEPVSLVALPISPIGLSDYRLFRMHADGHVESMMALVPNMVPDFDGDGEIDHSIESKLTNWQDVALLSKLAQEFVDQQAQRELQAAQERSRRWEESERAQKEIEREREANPVFRAQRGCQELVGYIELLLTTERVHVGHIPSDLNDLLLKPSEGGFPKGPYISSPKSLIDPWGNAYVVPFPDTQHNRFTVISMGPDGTLGTVDDIWAKGGRR